MHLKDYARREDRDNVPIGDGVVGYEGLVPAAVAAGAEWLVVEQDAVGPDPFGAVERSLARGAEDAPNVTPLGSVSSVRDDRRTLRQGRARVRGLAAGRVRRPRPAARRVAARRPQRSTRRADRRADVDLVLNLTPPDWHAASCEAAIDAGKHVYTEKPLAATAWRTRRLVPRRTRRRAAGRQRARHVPRRGDPDAAHGDRVRGDRHAGARPGPAAGRSARALAPVTGVPLRRAAGPLFDLGPYAVATAVELVGPVRRVTALATRPRTEGVFGHGPRTGTAFAIHEPTRVSAVLEHDGGVLTTLTASFDADGPAFHGVEVVGSGGTLLGGDPNGFDGPVILRRRGEPDETLPLVADWRHERAASASTTSAARCARPPQRASGALGLHVVEVAEAAVEAVNAHRGRRSPHRDTVLTSGRPVRASACSLHRV